jgi:hypothetical protein
MTFSNFQIGEWRCDPGARARPSPSPARSRFFTYITRTRGVGVRRIQHDSKNR